MVKRREKVLGILKSKDLDGIFIKSRENLLYLTGFKGSEGSLLLTENRGYFFTDSRYITYAKETIKGMEILEIKGERDLSGFISDLSLRKIGFEDFAVTYREFSRWQRTFKDVELIPLGKELEQIRKNKDQEEIEKMKKAIKIAEEVFFQILSEIKEGIMERDIAIEFEYRLKRTGAQSSSFPIIFAFGERSALPHAFPSQRRLKYGDVILFDFGAVYEDYCSDETFTLCFGKKDETLEKVCFIVSEAKKRAIDQIKEGVVIGEVDRVAREYIRDSGFGDYFGHGLGHGIGISVHEAPTINYQNNEVFESSMVFTIEPGIYIPYRFGVRLEDMFLLMEEKVEPLTSFKEHILYI